MAALAGSWIGGGANMLAIVDGVPRTLRIDQLIRLYVAHQLEVIVRRTKYRLRKAEVVGLRFTLALAVFSGVCFLSIAGLMGAKPV